MSERQGPAKGPTTTDLPLKRSTAPHLVIAGAVRLDIAIGPRRFAYLVDTDSPTGVLRDIAETIALTAGCGLDVALAAVIAALAPPAGKLEAAA
jgi:hypothetical protein